MRKKFVPFLMTALLLGALAQAAFAGGGVNIGTIRTFVQAIFGGTINITATPADGDVLTWSSATSSWGAASGGGGVGWDDVLAVDPSSGANNPVITTGSRLVIGATGAGTGYTVQYNSGDMEWGVGDGTTGTVNFFGRRSADVSTGSALVFQGGYNTSTGPGGSVTIRGGQAGSGAGGNVFVLGGLSTGSTNDGVVFIGGNGTSQWQFETDGDLLQLVAADGQGLIFRGATTSGARLEVNSGFLDVREGDDSALSLIRAASAFQDRSTFNNFDTHSGTGSLGTYELNIVQNFGAPYTLSLPNLIGFVGYRRYIVMTDGSVTNATRVVVAPNAGDGSTIDGHASLTLSTPFTRVEFTSNIDNTVWQVTGWVMGQPSTYTPAGNSLSTNCTTTAYLEQPGPFRVRCAIEWAFTGANTQGAVSANVSPPGFTVDESETIPAALASDSPQLGTATFNDNGSGYLLARVRYNTGATPILTILTMDEAGGSSNYLQTVNTNTNVPVIIGIGDWILADYTIAVE